MIHAAWRTLLVGLPGVPSRVNPGSDMVNVTKDLPRVVYSLVDDPQTYTDSGAMGLQKARYQLDNFAGGYDEARAIAGTIAAPVTRSFDPGLDGWRGDVQGTRIQRIYFPGTGVGKAENVPGQNQVIARATVDVLIDYRELPPQPPATT